VLDALVQIRRDKAATKHLLRTLLKRQARAPRVMVTDTLKSYGAAKRAIIPRGRASAAQGPQQPARRTRTSRPEGGSGRGSGSNHPGRFSASCPFAI
jgi:putative transposase